MHCNNLVHILLQHIIMIFTFSGLVEGNCQMEGKVARRLVWRFCPRRFYTGAFLVFTCIYFSHVMTNKPYVHANIYNSFLFCVL